MGYTDMRSCHRVILELVHPHSQVLDLGCGNGELLEVLIRGKNCCGRGIEIDTQAIYACIAKGLNVLHGDIDSGLAEYRDKSFDYVILNQSLQQVNHVESVLEDALRVGKKVIVGFPNFAHYKSRLQLFFCGRAPVTRSLPYSWYESPNLHFLSVNDFVQYCRKRSIRIEQHAHTGKNGRVSILPNLLALEGIFVIS